MSKVSLDNFYLGIGSLILIILLFIAARGRIRQEVKYIKVPTPTREKSSNITPLGRMRIQYDDLADNMRRVYEALGISPQQIK